MSRRLELHELLCELLGSDHVYYQPPTGLKMEYPCIRYEKDNIDSDYADDMSYSTYTRYLLTVIDKKPDNPVIEELLKQPYCGYGRLYKADNLYHDTLTIYY